MVNISGMKISMYHVHFTHILKNLRPNDYIRVFRNKKFHYYYAIYLGETVAQSVQREINVFSRYTYRWWFQASGIEPDKFLFKWLTRYSPTLGRMHKGG